MHGEYRLSYMKRNERFRAARLHSGLSQSELGRRVGLKQPFISELEQDPTKSTTKMVEYAMECGVNPVWLATGRGQMITLADEIGTYNVEPGPERTNDVPVISWTQAGDWEPTNDPYAPGEAEEWLPNVGRGGPHTYALRVRGASMEPEVRDGEIIFVDPERMPRHKDLVVARLANSDRTTFKQYVEDENGDPFLRAINQSWDPVVIPADETVWIKGVVIFHGRSR